MMVRLIARAHEDADIQGDKEGDVGVTLNVNLDFGNSLEGFAKLSLKKIPAIVVEKKGARIIRGCSMIVNPLTGVGYSLETKANYYVIKVERLYTSAKSRRHDRPGGRLR